MSVKSKLDRLTAAVDVPETNAPVVAIPAQAAVATERTAVPKTGPGALMKFLNDRSETEDRIRALTDQLKSFEDALPVRKLEASRVKASKFANRHDDHFQSTAYAQLVDDIAAAGGNIQPIRVRAINGDDAHDYEVVFGHRRLRACQQLNLPVSAMIAADDDTALFEAMCRENSSREDLTAFEEGMSYRRAIEAGLYPSQVKLATAIGVTQAHVSQVIAVATLPVEVLAAFPSPLDVQYRWAEALHVTHKTDRSQLLARVNEVAGHKFMSAKQVFEHLTAKPRPASIDVVVDGKKRAVIRSNHGVVSVAFSKNALSDERMTDLQALLARFLDASA